MVRVDDKFVTCESNGLYKFAVFVDRTKIPLFSPVTESSSLSFLGFLILFLIIVLLVISKCRSNLNEKHKNKKDGYKYAKL